MLILRILCPLIIPRNGPHTTPSFSVNDASLLVLCLALDVLLFGALFHGNVFTDPLPSNGYTRHITVYRSVTYKGDLSLNVDYKNKK
jgi:hypothetical protein